MKKLTPIVLLAVALAAILPIHGQEKGTPSQGQQDHGQGNQKSGSHTSPSPPATQGSAIKQEGSKPNGDRCANHSQSYFARLFSPENLPNIALVVVAIGGIIVAVFTLIAIDRQAKIADKTLVLQFRPKLIVRGGEVYDPDTLRIEFTVVNVGGSPAHIDRGEAEAQIVDSRQVSILEHAESIGMFSLQPGEGATRSVSLRENVAAAIGWLNAHPEGVMGAASPLVYFVGLIRYADDIGISRSMGFMRKYDPPRQKFVAVDDPDYEYTD